MDNIGMSSGTPTFIDEIIQKHGTSGHMIGSSVCVTGKLVDHNVNKCLATLIDPSKKHEIDVDTTHIEPFEAKLGSLYQMTGELDAMIERGDMIVVKTRVVRCVDGMDLSMYRKAIEFQRFYIAQRNKTLR